MFTAINAALMFLLSVKAQAGEKKYNLNYFNRRNYFCVLIFFPSDLLKEELKKEQTTKKR